MRLADLNPRWSMDAHIVVGGQTVTNYDRDGMGLSFDCPCCGGATRLAVFFKNPTDGGPPSDDGVLWQRTGETFETLTLTPSIDASKQGHWHGFITNGEVKSA